jgi:hypothetical protein
MGGMNLKIPFTVFLALSSAAVTARASVSDSAPTVASFEGTYDRQGEGCPFASQVVFSEETDPRTDLVTYHLQLLREDGRVWNSREFRQLNGLPWYEADVGNDSTVSGRSRFGCTGPDCTLWNEHNTCKGLVFPHCTGWIATRMDEVVFEGATMQLTPEDGSRCAYVKR